MHTKNNKKIYNALLEFFNVNEVDNINSEEKAVMDYILGEGITEANGQEILNRFLKVLNSGKKNLITATVIASLMSNVAFSSAVKQAPDNVKAQITQIMKSGGDGESNVKKASDSKLMINFSNNFESGTFDIDPNEVYAKLGELKDFFNNNGTSFKVKISASESQVPNQGSFKIGDLAKKRASIMSSLVKNYLEKNGVDGIKVDVSINIGDTAWDGNNKDDEKYTRDQYVKLEVFADGVTPCELSFNKDDGSVASAKNNYISFEEDLVEGGTIKLTPGSIPDRLQIVGVNGIINDSGYFADAKHPYNQWNVVPQYIAQLTEILINNPNSPAVKGLEKDIKAFSSYENLVNYMLLKKNHDYQTDNRSEVRNGLKTLKKLWDSGQRKFLFYSTNSSNSNMSFKLENNQKAKLIVYSPIGKTGFGVQGQCN